MKFDNYYDISDPWVDDEQEPNEKKLNLPCAELSDFHCIPGSLVKFTSSKNYKERLRNK